MDKAMNRVALIYKVLSAEATAEEQAALDHWILESEENRREFEDISLLWESLNSQDDNDPEDEAGFLKIKMRMKAHLEKRQRMRTISSTVLLALMVLALVALLMNTWFAPVRQIQFESTRMSEVIKVLEKTYGIEIHVSNPRILDCRYSAVVLKVEDELPVLSSIEHSLNVKFIDLGRKRYNLVGEGCR